ncbi:MAG TPA: SigE family RNA polymerase sigma factor [Mycobacteriales bacterium]|nr:SigE family RNA polymerase sigma factor [Mycobacteriales bacterium]
MDATAEQEFRDYVVARGPALQRLAHAIAGGAAEAEDAVQEALIRVYMAWPRIRRRDAVDAYTRRVLVRELMSRRRQRLARPTGAMLSEPSMVSADAGIAERDVLRRALLQLPPRQRAVVVLRFLEDLSEAQTAEALGISPGAAKTHASRGLTRLRELLGPPEVAS